MKQKGFAHILLVLIVVVVGIAGIGYYAYKNGQVKIFSRSTNELVSPTPGVTGIDTSNWNTYTDPKFSYSIKYPSNWSYRDYKDGVPPTFTSPEKEGALPKYILSITGYNNSLKTYDQRLFKVWGSSCIGTCPEEGDSTKIEGVDYQIKEPSVQEKTINNTKAYYITPYANDEINVIIPIPNKDTYLLVSPEIWSKGDKHELFDQILSTFKFINPTTTIVNKDPEIVISEEIKAISITNSWSTFTGPGFLIKYPADELFSQKVRPDKALELSYYKTQTNIKTEVVRIIVSQEPTNYKSVAEIDYPFSSFIKIGDYVSLVTSSDTHPADFCATYNFINSQKHFVLHTINPSNSTGGSCDRTYLNQILPTIKFL